MTSDFETSKLENLLKRFYLDDLKRLAFDLGVEHEVFTCQQVKGLATALIDYCSKNERLGCLVSDVLKRQEDRDLAQLLQRLPKCSPSAKIQITFPGQKSRELWSGEEREVREVSALWADFARILRVSESQLIRIGAAGGQTVRLLVGVPASPLVLEALSEPYELTGGKPDKAQAILLDSLQLIPQETWRLVACNQPPISKGNSLRLTVTWRRASEIVSSPSSLLCQDGISPAVEALLASSRVSRLTGIWEQSERRALDALQICANGVEKAVTHVHLEDLYREVWAPESAIEHGERAYQIFRRQPAQAQRFNEAMAAYALGLVHEKPTFSGSTRALRWYQRALPALLATEEYWARLNDRRRIRICQFVTQQIDGRTKEILEERTGQDEQRAAFNIWRLDSLLAPFAKDLRSPGYVIGDQDDHWVSVNDKDYLLDCFPETSIGSMDHYFALPMDETWAIPGARTADYVFVRQQWTPKKLEPGDGNGQNGEPDSTDKEQDREKATSEQEGQVWFGVHFRHRPDGGDDVFIFHRGKPNAEHESGDEDGENGSQESTDKEEEWDGESVKSEEKSAKEREQPHSDEEMSKEEDESQTGVMWEPGNGWLSVDFKRDQDGNIQFIRRPSRILGREDPTGKLKGYVVAMLTRSSK